MKASLKGHARMMYDVIVYQDRRSSNDQPGFSKIQRTVVENAIYVCGRNVKIRNAPDDTDTNGACHSRSELGRLS